MHLCTITCPLQLQRTLILDTSKDLLEMTWLRQKQGSLCQLRPLCHIHLSCQLCQDRPLIQGAQSLTLQWGVQMALFQITFIMAILGVSDLVFILNAFYLMLWFKDRELILSLTCLSKLSISSLSSWTSLLTLCISPGYRWELCYYGTSLQYQKFFR